MKDFLSTNNGLMMDVKFNLDGDLLCYMVIESSHDMNLKKEFSTRIIPELDGECGLSVIELNGGAGLSKILKLKQSKKANRRR